MPSWMRAVSVLSPVRWGILGLEGAIWRHFTLSEMALPCAILVGVGIVGFVVGWLLSARRDV
jgi:ABC-2 type transport system permease protein